MVPKDPVDKLDQCGVVYQLACATCPASYVGESARPLRTRTDEHSTRPESPVTTHASQLQHLIDSEGVKILIDREDNWFRRGVKEAIHIKKTGSELNKDRRQHHLNTVYNKLIVSLDSDPSGSDHMTSPDHQ